jgi:hypothetical protein
MLITTFNPTVEDLEKTYLSDPTSAGITSISVRNNDRFAANDRIMIGEMGQEKTEVVTVSAISGGTNITCGATVFSHEADTPIYKLRFDQVKIYRASSLTSSYSLLTTLSLDVDNADLSTIYDDITGTSNNYYKTSAYHSISTLESALSDPIQGSGWRRNQVGYIVDEILREVSDTNEVHVTRLELLGYFNDVNDDLTINVSKPYDFLHTRTTLTRTANINYINFPVDSYGDPVMWKFDRMDYNFTDSTTSPATDLTTTIKVYPSEEFRNIYSDNTISSTTVSDKTPVAMTLDTAVSRFRFSHPATTTLANVFYLYYWKFFTRISSEGNVIETPTAKIYKLYCKAMYYQKRSLLNPALASISQNLTTQYNIEKSKYKGVDRKDKGTPRAFRPQSRIVKGFRR